MSQVKTHERFAAHISRTPSPSKDPDAGLRGLSHYERRLPPWRFRLRQKLIPLVRWETPYLAHVQHVCRAPWLDAYFAFTANLGTHTFFMIALPICFWCGYPEMGMALIHMLAMGVYISGYVKDLACLPRPLSPPLQRITMSGSAALEYGFPSTHTTNAVSVALYCLYQLQLGKDNYTPMTYNLLQAGMYCYATSISIGRMYCGMHGFFDVIFGGALGAAIAWIRIAYGPAFDIWVLSDGALRPFLVVLVLGIAVRIHPEPADNCPCFDDSVAFSGVVMGAAIGIWHHAQLEAGRVSSLDTMYPFRNSDLLNSVIRIVAGVIVVFLWRAIMKPALLKGLPPVFRFVGHYGLAIPRRYFLQSRDYTTVPPLRRDDNVIPTASEIPGLMSSLRYPRKRTVSIGPQSEADAREFIANRREQRRRDSLSGGQGARKKPSLRNLPEGSSLPTPAIEEADASVSSSGSYLDRRITQRKPSDRHFLQVDTVVDPALLTPPPSDGGGSDSGREDSGKEDERDARKIFGELEKPRIRYDVEVITKLVVYAGIAWWAIIGNPVWFKWVGLC